MEGGEFFLSLAFLLLVLGLGELLFFRFEALAFGFELLGFLGELLFFGLGLGLLALQHFELKPGEFGAPAVRELLDKELEVFQIT